MKCTNCNCTFDGEVCPSCRTPITEMHKHLLKHLQGRKDEKFIGRSPANCPDCGVTMSSTKHGYECPLCRKAYV